MKDIHEVLRRKQAQYAEIGKQIEALQGAAETLKSVASLLAEDSDGHPTSGEYGAPAPTARATAASAAPVATAKPAAPARTTVPRWP
jgi:hypothetical protein